MTNQSRRHHKGGDFGQTTSAPAESTSTTQEASTMQVVQQKATGFLDSLKEYASNIKNKASEYMNKATTGGRKTKKLRKPIKKSKSIKKHHKRKTHHKRK